LSRRRPGVLSQRGRTSRLSLAELRPRDYGEIRLWDKRDLTGLFCIYNNFFPTIKKKKLCGYDS
jgi:hypothetical protein